MGQSRDEILSIIKPAVVGWIDEVLRSSPVVSSQMFVSTGPPTGAAGGDLAGSYPNPTVDGLQGRAVDATAPSSGQVYRWTGSLWLPGNIDTIAGTITDAQHGTRSGGTLHAAATTSTAGFATLATNGGTTAGTVVQANDSRLTNNRTPTAHASTHHSGGSDPLDLGSIAGTITDAQHGTRSGGTLHAAATTSTAGFATLATNGGTTAGTVVQANDSRLTNSRTPTAHASTHHSGGSDPLDLGSIAGTITDAQHGTRSGGTLHAAATTSTAGFATLATNGGTTAGTVVQANDSRLTNSRTPTAHASTHHSGGSDPLALGSIAGTITDAQHGTRGGGTLHAAATTAAAGFATLAADGGTTAGTVVQATDGRLTNARTPTAHASTHHSGGSDPLALGSIAGTLTDTQHGTRGGGTLHAAATTAAAGFATLATNGGTTAGTVVQANDGRLSDSRTPTGTAGGDLAGTYPNPTVDGLQGRTVASTAPSSGQVLGWDGSQWEPMSADDFRVPRMHLRKTVGQNITSSVETSVTWDSEVVDTGGWWTSGATISLPIGIYDVFFQGRSAATASGFIWEVGFTLTGTDNVSIRYGADRATNTDYWYYTNCLPIVMNTAGTLTVTILQKSGITISFGNASIDSFPALLMIFARGRV